MSETSSGFETEGPRSADAADILAIARQVAAEASDTLRSAAGNVGHIDSKTNVRDLVTVWDQRIEEQIRSRLAVLTPSVPMLGEETGESAQTGAEDSASGSGVEELWIVDPIDGTVNFAHGLPIFSVSIAFERRGHTLAGAVYAPVLGWEFYGHLGGGAFMNDKALSVSKVVSLERAMLVTGFPYDRASNPDANFDRWEHFQRRAGACRRLGSAALDLCMVACGWMDGYWERYVQPWDIAAGALLVGEAGGTLSDFSGASFYPRRGEVLATNGLIHQQMLAELAMVGSQWTID